jgi:hypothetical protein
MDPGADARFPSSACGVDPRLGWFGSVVDAFDVCSVRPVLSMVGEKNVSASESESVGMSGTSGRSAAFASLPFRMRLLVTSAAVRT